MKVDAGRRLAGLALGAALIVAGALEVWLHQSDYATGAQRVFCRAGFCADQFSPARVFAISQRATLGDPKGEVQEFQQALRLDPGSAYRWADLGEAEVNVRDYKAAQYAFSRALRAGPRSLVILMRAANAYFEMGLPDLVVPQLAAVLRDPELHDYYEAAFLTLSRLGIPTAQILNAGVPRREDVASALLIFFCKVNRPDDAVATWKWASQPKLSGSTRKTVAVSGAPPKELVSSFLPWRREAAPFALLNGESMERFFSFLIKDGRQNLAQQLWQERAVQEEPGYRTANYVYNPGFEDTPWQSPFDWTTEARQDLDASRVQGDAFAGKWALKIRFNGLSNTAYYGTYQDMVLAPGRYSFSVALKSEAITTDEGVRIHIYDWPTQAKLNYWSDTALGTKGWTKVGATFEVPAGIKVVRVEIARKPSMMFDNKIGGSAWVDDLRLTIER